MNGYESHMLNCGLMHEVDVILVVRMLLNSVEKRPEKIRIGRYLSPLTKPANNFFPYVMPGQGLT